MFAPLYTCKSCGEVWRTYTYEDIDTKNDEVYTFKVCANCLDPVTPVLHDSKPVLYALSEEEVFWENYYPD